MQLNSNNTRYNLRINSNKKSREPGRAWAHKCNPRQEDLRPAYAACQNSTKQRCDPRNHLFLKTVEALAVCGKEEDQALSLLSWGPCPSWLGSDTPDPLWKYMRPSNAKGRSLVSCAPHPRSAQHLGWRPPISVSRGRRLSPHQHSLALKWALEAASWALGKGRLNASYQVLCSGYLTISMPRTGKGQRSLWLWEGDQTTRVCGNLSP